MFLNPFAPLVIDSSFTVLCSCGLYVVGVDQGLGDGVRRRRRLLPGQQRYRVGRQRRERPPLHPPARPDHAAQRTRN